MVSICLRRSLGHTSRLCTQHFTKTTLAPHSFKLIPPTEFQPQSLLVFATPTNLTRVIDQTIKLYEQEKIPVVVAGVDSIINSNRNGISELWSDEPIKINNYKILQDEPETLRESDGINVVSAKVNWKNIESNFQINFGINTLKINLSNTIFQTNKLVTLYFLNEFNDGSGRTLSDLSIDIPLETKILKSSDKWIKLTDKLVISDFKGNLLKSINNKSAASFLEQNKQLLAISSKETEVYCKIYSKSRDHPLKYEVIAGGGGWGAKANIIALSPEAKVSKGDLIEFYMLTPKDKATKETILFDELINKFTLESTYEELSYNDDTTSEQILPGVLGCGSEQGFSYNGIKYASNGEVLTLQIEA